jgi:hypothetical protein
MANHNKNKRFGGDNFERFRKQRSTGQDALERERQRKLERGPVRPLLDETEDFFSSYSDLSDNN